MRLNGKMLGGAFGGALLAGGAAYPDEAEAAARKNFEKLFIAAAERAKECERKNIPQEPFEAGTLPDEAYRQLKELFPKLNSKEVLIAAPHGLISRDWENKRMANLYKEGLNSETGLKGVRNKGGIKQSPVALWHQAKKISGFFPVKEVNGKILILTGMPEKTSRIQNYLVKNGWGLGSRSVPPADATLENLGLLVPDSQPVRIPAAIPKKQNTFGNTSGNTLGDAFAQARQNKTKIGGGLLGAGAGFGLSSSDAFGAEGLSGGWGSGGFSVPKTFSAESALRNLGIGTRGLLEGAGSGLSLGMADPGRVVSDWLNLPKPQTDMEKDAFRINRGVTEALAGSFGGAGLARKALTPLWRSIWKDFASYPVSGAALNGLMSYALPSE